LRSDNPGRVAGPTFTTKNWKPISSVSRRWLIACAWAATKWPGTLVDASGWLFVVGTIIFFGSLYALSLSGMRWLGAITPFGGLAFLAGWICLAVAALRAG
jgi:uncharacterized membrane protein YgdD (TMEM256/DUF423 family)